MTANVVPFEKPRAQTVPVLKRLSSLHRDLISLLLQGVAVGEAAGIVGYTRQRVTQLLGDPLFLRAMDEQRALWDVELTNLTGTAVDVIRDSLKDADPEVRLKAARMQLETQGKFRKGEGGEQSAEDAVAKIISIAVQNMQVVMPAALGAAAMPTRTVTIRSDSDDELAAGDGPGAAVR